MADINSNLPVIDITDGTPGSAVPAYATQLGGTDGTNLRALSLDTTGKLNINNISGTISLPTGASTSANQTNGSQKSQIVDGSGNVINSNKYSTTYGIQIYNMDSNQTDNLQRLRVSEGNIIYYASFQNSTQAINTRNSVTGSATVTASTANSAIRLTCTTSSSDSAILQSMPYLPYMVGRSIFFTFGVTLGAKKTNVRQRIGYFDANDGMFFEQTGTDLAIVTRTSASGSAVDTRVLQANWNLDKLDGTGSSGFTLDTSKYVSYVIDFISGGRVRFGVLIGGIVIYCHQVFAGNLSSTPICRTFVLPLRVELTNTGTAASTTTLDLMSFSGERESSEPLQTSIQFSASRGTTSISATGTTKPLISIRPKTTFNGITNRVPILPVSNLVLAGSQNTLVSVVLNPTLTGAAFASVDTNSAVEADTTATAVSGGTIIYQYYVGANTGLLSVTSGTTGTNLNTILLGLNIAGSTADILTVTVTSTAGGSNTFGSITWQEYQ